jgi:neutral ceramidase
MHISYYVTLTLLINNNNSYAAIKFEQAMNPPESPTGMPTGFVAAFSQTNMGDVSPNTEGAKCLDTGLPCDYKLSTCNGRNEMCIAR